MLKTLAASSAAKAAALCVCPVVGAGVIATQVPQVRKAIHKATAPKKPIRASRALPRIEEPCITPASVAQNAVPGAVPRVAQILPLSEGNGPLAELPAVAEEATPTVASTLPSGGIGGPGGGFIALPGTPGGGGGGGGGGFLPPDTVVTPPILPVPGGPGAVPEPAAWVQMTGGFLVVGATIRFVKRQQQQKCKTGGRWA